jgi:DedD protein
MARPISDEELLLRKRARRRLIGAVVLVAAVVVALPMLLDSEPKPVSQDINIRIPSSDPGTFTSKVVPISPAPDSKPVPKLPATVPGKLDTTPNPDSKTPKTPASIPAAPAAKPEAARAISEPAKQAEAAPTATAAAQAPQEAGKKPAAPAGQFVVQVIALADAQKARQMHQQMSAAGIKSYTEVVKTKKGDVTRVRAGPFATSDAAEEARVRLKGIGLDGKVIPK